MESIIILIPIGRAFVGTAVWVLFRALRDGQFDDLERPAWQVVFDDLDDRKAKGADSSDNVESDTAKRETPP